MDKLDINSDVFEKLRTDFNLVPISSEQMKF